jgi:hypothetical protein
MCFITEKKLNFTAQDRIIMNIRVHWNLYEIFYVHQKAEIMWAKEKGSPPQWTT